MRKCEGNDHVYEGIAKDFVEIDFGFKNVFSYKVGLSGRRPGCRNLCFSRRALHTLKAKLVGATAARSFVFSVTTGAYSVTHLHGKWSRRNAPQAGADPPGTDRHLLL